MEWTETVPESAPVKPVACRSATAFFFLVALALALPYFREKPLPQGGPIRFQIAFPDKVSPNTTGAFALSPDGRHLAFAGVGSDGVERLWLRTLESLEPRALPGTESNWISTIFWLPDSRFIVFPAGGKLKKVDISGGPPQILCNLNNIIVGGSSNPDGVILFAEYSANAIRQISAAGGDSSIVVKPGPEERGTYYYHPIFLPDGRHFLYLISSRTPEKTGIYIGQLNSKPEEWPGKKILATDFGIAYKPSQNSDTGQIFFLREETLMAQQFDEKRLELIGQAVTVTEHVGSIYGVNGYFSVSTNGTLIFRGNDAPMSQLSWFDRKGKPVGVADASGASCSGLALSPDGSRAVVSWLDSQAPRYLDLWILDFLRGRKTRFTLGRGYSYEPVWSPDGSQIVFRLDRGGSIDLNRKHASGVQQEELLLNSNDNKVVMPTSWSRDGRFLLFSVENPNSTDLWVLPLDGDHKPIPFAGTEFDERNGRFSPDMHWVAYESNETGIAEIYVRAFSGNSSGLSLEAGGVAIVSNGGGVAPRWRGDGKELYYRDPDGRVMAVDVAAGTRFEAGMPTELFKAPAGHWDAAPDGQQFLLLTPLTESTSSPFNVILNWTSSLKK
jgi:Tol biopolymer transport system component